MRYHFQQERTPFYTEIMEPIYMTRLSAPRTLEDATIIFVLGKIYINTSWIPL